MRLPLSVLCGALLLAGCGKGDDADREAPAAFVPPETQAPRPLPGQAQTIPLSAYVGHYPDEPIDGVGFYDRTDVSTALDAAVIDADLRRQIVRNVGPRIAVFRVGDRIASWGCRASDCGNSHWTVLIDAAGKAEVCLYKGSESRWYAGSAPVRRPGECPAPPKAS
ncbi:MAG TPA: hypothetical protein VFQ57_07325 [Sphingomonas sp.]|jgi:hypothetical protein|nr:hypothetical protein [Sphingomonas sp.]